jgi:hypothetical protein
MSSTRELALRDPAEDPLNKPVLEVPSHAHNIDAHMVHKLDPENEQGTPSGEQEARQAHDLPFQGGSPMEHPDEASEGLSRSRYSAAAPAKQPVGWEAAGSPFDEKAEHMAKRVVWPFKQGGGPKEAHLWHGNDLLKYFSLMIPQVFEGRSTPEVSAKERGLAKKLITWLKGGHEAQRLLDFTMKNWDMLREKLKVNGALTFPVFWGFRESFQEEMNGGGTLSRTHRAKEPLSDEETMKIWRNRS